MTKIKFVRHPRSIVRMRYDHHSSLFVAIPAKIVKQWSLKQGEIMEFVFVTEDIDSFIKVRKVVLQA